MIKDKLIDLIDRTFNKEGCPYLAGNDRNAFFTSESLKNIMCCLAFNTTSRYLDDILNINNVYFDNMVSQIYP